MSKKTNKILIIGSAPDSVSASNWKNLINPNIKFENKNTFTLKPFETIWLANT